MTPPNARVRRLQPSWKALGALMLIFLPACTSSNSDLSLSSTTPQSITDSSVSSPSASLENSTTDILTRLNARGSEGWEEDAFGSLDSRVESIYLGGTCAVWVFPDQMTAETSYNDGLFEFFSGEVWYGGDSVSEKGVVLLTEGNTTSCYKTAFAVFDWSDEGSTETTSQSAAYTKFYDLMVRLWNSDARPFSQNNISKYGGESGFCTKFVSASESDLGITLTYDDRIDFVLACTNFLRNR